MNVPEIVEEMFHKVISSLEENHVSYMVFGGLAYGVWGDPRFTDDVDVVMALRESEVVRVLRGMRTAGFQVDEDLVIQTLQISGVVRIGYKGYFTDFMVGESEFEKEAFKRKKQARIFGQDVFVVSAEDVLIYKIYAGRPHDLEDARRIILRQKSNLDSSYIDRWIRWIAEKVKKPEIALTWNGLKLKYLS